MTNSELDARGLQSPGPFFVAREGFFPDTRDLPLVCHFQACPGNGARELPAEEACQWLSKRLTQSGAVLLRGLQVRDASGFEAALAYFSVALGDDLTGNSRRLPVQGKILESSRLEHHHTLDLHNEATYKLVPPRLLFFCCIQAAPDGGETPIARSRRVFDRIDPEIRQQFLAKRIQYSRYAEKDASHYIQGWRDSFQTGDRQVVESICRTQDIAFRWLDGDRLWLSEIRDAAVTHPVTGRRCWVNQVHLTHWSRWVRTGVLAGGLPAECYPTNCSFGDGSAIPLDVVGHIRRCWLMEETIFIWQPGDILVLDNLRVAHGRRPYYGPRELLLAIGQ